MTCGIANSLLTSGYNECVNYECSQNSVNNIYVSGTYSSKITLHMVYVALSHIIYKYPPLVMTIEDCNKGRLNDLGQELQLRPVSKILFTSDLVEFIETADSKAYLKRISKDRFDYDYCSGRPMWKIYVVSAVNKLVIVANPTLIDHIMLLDIQRQFSKAFNNYQDSTLALGKTLVKNVNISNRLFQYPRDFAKLQSNMSIYCYDNFNVKLPKSSKLKLKLFGGRAKAMQQCIYKPQHERLTNEPFNSKPGSQIYVTSTRDINDYKYKFMHLDAVHTDKLLQLCELRDVEVEAVVLVCYWIALNHQVRTEKFVDVDFAVDVRNYLKNPQVAGNYVDYVKMLLDPVEEFSWEVVDKYWGYIGDVLNDLEGLLTGKKMMELMPKKPAAKPFMTFTSTGMLGLNDEQDYGLYLNKYEVSDLEVGGFEHEKNGHNFLHMAGTQNCGYNFMIGTDSAKIQKEFSFVMAEFKHTLENLPI